MGLYFSNDDPVVRDRGENCDEGWPRRARTELSKTFRKEVGGAAEILKEKWPNFGSLFSVIPCSMRMKWAVVVGTLAVLAVGTSLAGFTGKDELVFPEHYREWVWLTSGLGM